MKIHCQHSEFWVKMTEKSIYDELSEEEKLKFWDKTGRLVFEEVTGETEYPQFIIDSAFELYVDGLTIAEIAVKWDINESIVKKWSKSQGWKKKLDKINKRIEDLLVDEKVKNIVTVKQELDKKHTAMIEWLQQEFMYTIQEDYKNEKDPKQQKAKQFWQMNRAKVLKLSSDAIIALIQKERDIVGIDVKGGDVRELPSDFVFTIEVPNGENITDEQLENYLPSQDPHNFLDGDQFTPEIKQIEAPRQNPTTVENLDPITIAQEIGMERQAKAAQQQAQQNTAGNHPAFGYLPFGNSF